MSSRHDARKVHEAVAIHGAVGVDFICLVCRTHPHRPNGEAGRKVAMLWTCSVCDVTIRGQGRGRHEGGAPHQELAKAKLQRKG